MESNYIGKFVCYDQADGGACWGRIKDEAVVNTMAGEKEVFILTDRYVRYVLGQNIKQFRRFYPDIDSSPMSKPMELDKDGKLQDGDFFHEVRKVRGDSTLRKEMIDLETDIVDLSDIIGLVDEETLFKAVLASGPVKGKTAREIGILALMENKELSEMVKAELKSRLQSGVEND